MSDLLNQITENTPTLIEAIYTNPALAAIFGIGIGLGLERLSDPDKRNYLRGFILGAVSGALLSSAYNNPQLQQTFPLFGNPYVLLATQVGLPILARKLL